MKKEDLSDCITDVSARNGNVTERGPMSSLDDWVVWLDRWVFFFVPSALLGFGFGLAIGGSDSMYEVGSASLLASIAWSLSYANSRLRP